MFTAKSFPKSLILVLLVSLVVGLLLACQADDPSPTIQLDPDYQGQILADGSSTVGPITMRIADAFNESYPAVEIQVQISGSGGGFKKFCQGETDISDASRPIKASEIEACKENGIEFIEIPVAFDGIAVVVNPENQFAICLTTDELNMIWEPDAENVVINWNQVRSDFPDQALSLYSPGFDSGTYDYFTEAVVGEESSSRVDFFASEDDTKLVQGVATDPNSLGFFGYAYYDQNRARLKLVSVDHGNGCVEPNTETVARGLYQPLSRPLFIYINLARIEQKPELNAFINFYLQNAAKLVDDVGYIALTDQIYQLAQQRYDQRETGSVFDGLGAIVGVSLADLLAK